MIPELSKQITSDYHPLELEMFIPWKSKVKQRMVVRMIHVKNSLLPRGKVWSLDFLGMYIIYIIIYMWKYVLPQ